MTIKEEIQIEEYTRVFAEAYKQGFIDAMNMCKTEPQTCSVNGRPYSECSSCVNFKCMADELQKERSNTL